MMNEELSKANCRIEQIVHLDSMCVDGRVADILEDILFDYDVFSHCLDEHITLDFEDSTRCEVEDPTDPVEVFQTLIKKGITGFCVQAATFNTYLGKEGTVFMSWGYSRMRWFYGHTYEEAVMRAVAWAQNDGKSND